MFYSEILSHWICSQPKILFRITPKSQLTKSFYMNSMEQMIDHANSPISLPFSILIWDM